MYLSKYFFVSLSRELGRFRGSNHAILEPDAKCSLFGYYNLTVCVHLPVVYLRKLDAVGLGVSMLTKTLPFVQGLDCILSSIELVKLSFGTDARSVVESSSYPLPWRT